MPRDSDTFDRYRGRIAGHRSALPTKLRSTACSDRADVAGSGASKPLNVALALAFLCGCAGQPANPPVADQTVLACHGTGTMVCNVRWPSKLRHNQRQYECVCD